MSEASNGEPGDAGAAAGAGDPDRVERRLDELERLFRDAGHAAYFGEPVSTAEHMLQTAVLAERAGHSPETVASGLLHDIGHLLHGLGEDIAERGVDADHERLGADYLADLFGPAVIEPLRLHVAAKRYLCATDPRYRRRLSEASMRSLDLQGGPMSPAEAAAFAALPHAEAAIALRRFDEAAKVPGKALPAFAAFRPLLRDCAARWAAAAAAQGPAATV